MLDINLLEFNIKDYISKLPEFQVRDFSYRMSKSGDCPRLMDYQIQAGEIAPEPSQAFRMYFGSHIHEMWRKIFEDMLPNDFSGAEREIEYHDGDITLTGHPDGEINSIDAVYELKSVSDNSFNMVVTNGTAMPMHYEQANMYAHTLRRKNILFHYFNKNNSESIFLLAPMSEELAKSTIDKFKKRKVNAEAKVIEDRPYTDPTSTPCWFCKFKDECYKGFVWDVKTMGTAKLDDSDEVMPHTQIAWDMRSTRLDAEKQESAAKAAIAHALIKRGIKAASIGEFTIDIKLGSKNNPITTVKEKKKK